MACFDEASKEMSSQPFERRYALILSHFHAEHPTVVSLYSSLFSFLFSLFFFLFSFFFFLFSFFFFRFSFIPSHRSLNLFTYTSGSLSMQTSSHPNAQSSEGGRRRRRGDHSSQTTLSLSLWSFEFSAQN